MSNFSLARLESFGEVAAEDDAVLSYFLTTDAVTNLEENRKFLILGRKGSGKTALVRHFAASDQRTSRALNLRNYPWSIHETRINKGASEVEAYVASWRYLIAVQLASVVLHNDPNESSYEGKSLRKFFKDNYGGTQPELRDLLAPSELILSKASFEPSLLGAKIGSISLDRTTRVFGHQLDALTNSLMRSARELATSIGLKSVFLHFDELDQGLTILDEKRKALLIGLILAARDMKREVSSDAFAFGPMVYLRTDIWDQLKFSDKNKISKTLTQKLEWNREELMNLVNERIKAALGDRANWDAITDEAFMRGSQSKWDHILARTFLRPRDVIAFLNSALEIAKKRNVDPLVFINEDIVSARSGYSNYLKDELDDEIVPHWGTWEEALRAVSDLATITFDKTGFSTRYEQRVSSINGKNAEDALHALYDFSVIGYQIRSGYGGSGWSFQYVNPEAGWDAASQRFKVHLGLKEYARLREERAI